MTRFLLAVILIALCTPLALANDPYTDDIVTAAGFIRQGSYDRAVGSINSALARRSEDASAHAALGIAFLHSGQVDAARKEFTAAQSKSSTDPIAAYGLGLCSLAKGDKDAALRQFTGIFSTVVDTKPVIAYISALSGKYPTDEPADNDLTMSQIVSQGYYQTRKLDDARKISDLIVVGRKGFTENTGAVMTFDAAKPLLFAGKPLSNPYKSPADSNQGLPKFKGTVTLKADLAKTQGIAYVVFYVDDKAIAIVNHTPYECRWNTLSYSNSAHMIKIEGMGLNGVSLSEKSVKIMVNNPGQQDIDALPQADIDTMQQELWDCIKLKPSAKLAYYTIAKCSQSLGDKSRFLSSIEQVVALDPVYKDAKQLLLECYQPSGKGQSIWVAQTKEKVVALTFDDGPGPKTDALLDILASKGVKATFFAVGQMAEANPSTIKRMVEDGHQVALHGYAHMNMKLISNTEILRELVRASSVLRSITGKSSMFFRPPGGNRRDNLVSAVGHFGFSPVYWTVNCGKSEGTTAASMIQTATSKITPGAIILMHNGEDITLKALPSVIDKLRAKGYRFTTISELISTK